MATTTAAAEEPNFRDMARYRQMAKQGVWSVGLGIEPVVSLTHPTSGLYGGHRYNAVGTYGFTLEGSYFVIDNLRLSASLGYVANGWGSMLLLANPYDASSTLSTFRLKVGGHWHEGRWDFGGRLVWGESTLNYVAANVAEGGTNDERFGTESFRDKRKIVAVAYEAGYMLTPFLRASVFWEPSLAMGGGYAHTLGARLTIWVPFISAIACK